MIVYSSIIYKNNLHVKQKFEQSSEITSKFLTFILSSIILNEFCLNLFGKALHQSISISAYVTGSFDTNGINLRKKIQANKLL